MSHHVISRHRLPRFYRVTLTVFWLTPIFILCGALVLAHGFTSALIDLRLLLPLVLMTIPALYFWQEGIDVLDDGIISRVHLPRYYSYEHLANWYFDSRPQRRVLTIWGERGKILECRAGHLTELNILLKELKERISYRGFPY
jgi:hypothetical protein